MLKSLAKKLIDLLTTRGVRLRNTLKNAYGEERKRSILKHFLFL